MGIYFGIAILILLILGLRLRKKEAKEWTKEDLKDEGGEWIERRSGDRGTYGSFDRANEAARQEIHHQAQINELALLFRTWFFDHYPGYHQLDEKTLREHTLYCKSEAYLYIGMIDNMLKGVMPAPLDPLPANGNKHFAELILHYIYDSFPALLDMEIEDIRSLDVQTLALAKRLEGYLE
jgi:hypothetical protein